MELSEALAFIQNNKTGVLGTVGPDGAPHLVVIGVAVKDGTLLISTPRTTVKARNIGRDPRVSLVFGTRRGCASTTGSPPASTPTGTTTTAR
ncbi:MAG: hypothetical protein E6G68_08300 [Actinobacteria bacterium]|nr:MAG: hypothetical protein E6G68_08300 [Actinomycetota bacterium]